MGAGHVRSSAEDEGAFMPRDFDVMVAGHLCFDVIPRFPDTGAGSIGEIMRPGKLVLVEECRMSTGGPVSNTGIALRLLGNRVCFSARVGDDEFGRLTVDSLKRRIGSAEGVRVVEGGVSSYTIAVAPPRIDRIFLHNPASNDLYDSDDLDPALVARCRHFHFGYPPLMRRVYANEGAELREILKTAKDAGATTSLDMALPDPDSHSGSQPWRKVLERCLPHVDLFLPSVEEALYMLDRQRFLTMKRDHADADLIDVLRPEDYSALAAELLSLGAKMTSLKSGHRGFYVRTGARERLLELGEGLPGDPGNWSGRELWRPSFEAPDLASATGSGDSAIAGFLTGFLKGLTVEESLKAAACLGWQNVQELDAISGIRSWEETLALLKKDMPVIDARVASPGWRWSEEHGLWAGPDDRVLGAGAP
jgi:sugar/nucleoside kinase (ribokinase family)